MMTSTIEFRGFGGFREKVPNVEIRTDTGVFDLHNAAEFQGFEFDADSESLTLRWTVEPDQWLGDDRAAVGRLVLTCGKVYRLQLDGKIEPRDADARVLDYVEYLPGNEPELVFALVTGVRIAVGCRMCEVRVVN